MTSGAHNLKTPLIGDKISKKGHFAMTPDIHTKTYAERQSMAAIGNAAGGLNPLVNPGSVGQAGAHTFSSIHQSAKQPSKAQHLMANTMGGSGVNTSSMIAGIGQSSVNNGVNQSNIGLYSGGNNIETEGDQHKMQAQGKVAGAATSLGELDNLGEDLLVMNISREGNAGQLNKSTKLTLSSKKQYDNHLQNLPLN